MLVSRIEEVEGISLFTGWCQQHYTQLKNISDNPRKEMMTVFWGFTILVIIPGSTNYVLKCVGVDQGLPISPGITKKMSCGIASLDRFFFYIVIF